MMYTCLAGHWVVVIAFVVSGQPSDETVLPRPNTVVLRMLSADPGRFLRFALVKGTSPGRWFG